MPLIVRLPSRPRGAEEYKFLNVLDRKKTAVQRELRRSGFGGYEPQFMSTVLALADSLPRGFVFYDVGAHIGLYSAVMEVLFAAKSYAFEPTPETFAECVRLRKQNGLDYRALQTAISTQSSGEIEFFISPKAETSNSLNSEFREGSTRTIIPVTNLDAVAGANGEDPHLLKIDVETHEPDVLMGALEMLGRAKPLIACELLPKMNLAKLAGSLSALGALGYRFVQVCDSFPWAPLSVPEVLSSLDADRRDWILFPGDLPDGFYENRADWLAELEKCGPESNILTAGKA